MDSLRFASPETVSAWTPCSRCAHAHDRWDKIRNDSYCPSCEESLVLGEAEPLSLRTEARPCAICGRQGTVRYLTFPLHSARPVEMDLCGEHLRSLLGRSLGPPAFHQLSRQLTALGVDAGNIFLLHEAFYDAEGHALQPALEP
jgi:hypothetical protein